MSDSKLSEPSTSNKSSALPKKSCDVSKLFKPNKEQQQWINSEYLDGNYKKIFNEIAPELRVIGGLGQTRCIKKKKLHQHVNRPTQVQRVSHTTTKFLPNFHLTSELKNVACLPETKPTNVFEYAERVKFAGNLLSSPPSSQPILNETKNYCFNSENPFDLDLTGLSEYQRQICTSEDFERRKNYHIIRRKMETKKLKTEGKERIEQQERDKKFGLPSLFDVIDTSTESGSKKLFTEDILIL